MLYAKRHYEGNTFIEETLPQHVENCLNVYEGVIRLFPECPVNISHISLDWEEMLFLLVVFHDTGKASKKFQDITLNINTDDYWHFRHEVLSAEFLDLTDIDERAKTALKLAILGHHEKSIIELSKVCFSDDCDFFEEAFSVMRLKREEIYRDAKRSVHDNWDECLELLEWIKKEYQKRFKKELNVSTQFDDMKDICNLIEDYAVSIQERENNFDYELILILKGILITCDHLGSAHCSINYISFDIAECYKQKFKIGSGSNDFYSIQKQSDTRDDSLLIAPTGSGKTEASFIWANNHLKNNQYQRIFYVLPYTASINGMYQRLENEEFAAGKVDMKHGKSLYAYYNNLLEKEKRHEGSPVENRSQIQAKARLIRQTSKEICNPVKLVTPHQITKVFYRVKGYETLLTELYNANFILDEIHCYDEELVCMLILAMQYIKRKLGGKLFVMSATFPEYLKEIIIRELDISNEISMSCDELEKFTKHRLNLINACIEECIDQIKENIERGRRVLVVCNTIKKAQYMYDMLKAYAHSHLLLHSYFAVKDRNKIEELLLNGEKKEEGYCPIQLLVGTQAIEVSLDLDFDMIYTELAPIDALIQRFGRVYRKRKRKEGEYGDTYVCLKYDRGSELIYNRKLKLLDKTLEKISKYDGVILTDGVIKDIIDYVYDTDYRDSLLCTLNEQKRRFKYVEFYPLQDYSEESEEFFKQFDGIKLCPQGYFDEYCRCIEKGSYIEADGRTITVPGYRIARYLREHRIGLIQTSKKHSILVAYKDFFDYSVATGLQEKNIKPGEGIIWD